MVPYEQFVFNKTRKINVTGLIVGLAIALLYQEADFLILPQELWLHATLFRFGFVIPLFLMSIYFCFARKRALFLITTTALVTVTTCFWYWALLIADSVSLTALTALLAVTIQAVAFCSLLLHLPIKFHYSFLFLLGALSILALLSQASAATQTLSAFGVAIIGLVTLSSSWVTTREKRYRRLYRALDASKARITTRSAWNDFLTEKVGLLRQQELPTLQYLLEAFNTDAHQLTFASRARDCLQEIDYLMARFARKTEWVNFVNRKDAHGYFVGGYLEKLIPELEAKYNGCSITLSVEKDFETMLAPDLFTRLITNLIENAHRAAKPNSPITIKVTESLKVVISNQGPPLSKTFAELTRAGEQSENAGKFGLGLYICSRICSANGIGLDGKNTNVGVSIQLDFEPSSNAYSSGGIKR
jgi:signal transduction histidine kinase